MEGCVGFPWKYDLNEENRCKPKKTQLKINMLRTNILKNKQRIWPLRSLLLRI